MMQIVKEETNPKVNLAGKKEKEEVMMMAAFLLFRGRRQIIHKHKHTDYGNP